jgi:FADH2 O2-dependent halogenase
VSGRYDLIVVGSGFGGSLVSMMARRLGMSVAMIERGKHPRFAIGESTTPLSNLLLEEIAERYDLPRLKPLTKWGTWRKTYPELACGLKRGFSFYPHPAQGERPLLVAASPNEASADTHWYRADFDHFLVKEAQAMGVDYVDRTALSFFRETEDGVEVDGFHGRFLVDASGPRGFLHRALGLAGQELAGYPRTQALYSHFSNVGLMAGEPGMPYPPDDAALHHVFEGGWIWVLRFNNGLTSAGVAATDEVAERFGFAEGAAAWERLLDSLPGVKAQFAGAKAELRFAHAPRLSFRSNAVAGRRWAMLPSAAGFIDPLLSTGFPLTLFGVGRLGEMLAGDWDADAYAASTNAELCATARLIGALYGSMGDFPLFARVSLLYFASASFAETARRLGKKELASSFLLCGDPVFGPASARLCERVMRGEKGFGDEVLRAIEPFDVAGLCCPERRNWYPVDAADLVGAAAKLGATESEAGRLLRRAGFESAGF